MTADEWKSVECLFHALLELPETEREGFLRSAGYPPEICAEVQRLLGNVAGDGFLESPALQSAGELINRAAGEAPDPPEYAGLTAQVPGTIVGSRYEIVRPLGKGGQSTVFLATDQRMGGRHVVVKVLKEQAGHQDWLKRHFRQEVEILSKIHHPGVIAAHDCGELPTGQPFLVMDFVDGITLRERLQSPIEKKEIAEIIREIGDALGESHRLGIFHRDLKPENIMLPHNGEPRRVIVIDFGIARIDQKEASSTGLSMIAGTTRYMAPEQFFGAASSATDVYALAVICFEMLTGQLPFELTDIARAVTERNTHRRDLTPELAKLPPAARPILRRALSRAPEGRPQDAAEFARRFGDALNATDRTWLAGYRNSFLISACAVATFVAAVVVIHPESPLRHRTAGVSPAGESPFTLLAPPARLTGSEELAIDPAMSAKGDLVAYSSDREKAGHLDIWIRDIASGRVTQLTHDPDGADQPTFSPDGATIAYHSYRPGHAIFTLPVGGGAAKKLVDGGAHPHYSPDGSLIAFLTGDPEQGDSVARVIPANGGRDWPIADDLAASAPIWSPDGERLLMWGKYGGGSSGIADFWLVPKGPGGTQRRTYASKILSDQGLHPPGAATYFGPQAWVADRIIFSARSQGASQFWSIRISDQTGEASGPAKLIDSQGVLDTFAASLPVGSGAFAFSTFVQKADIWQLPVGTAGIASSSTLKRLTSDPSMAIQPSIARDSGSLAFISYRSGRRQVWHKNLKTGKETPLTSDPDVRLAPRISPDGVHVVFTTERDRTRVVWKVQTPPQSGAPQPLCDRCGKPLGWWPDGQHLLMDREYDNPSPATGHRLFYRDFRLGNEVAVPTDLYWIEPKVSSDGKWVVFLAYPTAKSQTWSMFVAKLEGGIDDAPVVAPEAQWIPLNHESVIWNPTWGADGNTVYYLSDADGHVCIRAQRVDKATKQPLGKSFPIFHSHEPTRSLGNLGIVGGIELSAVPGGLVFSQGERSGAIWLAHVRR